MQNTTSMLNFNVNRELLFRAFRAVDFEEARGLTFDPRRTLTFSATRDLGFGKRGVVFRGYVCPVCRAPVSRDAPRCYECGTAFVKQAEQRQQARVPTGNVSGQKAGDAARRVNRGKRSTAKVRQTFQCPMCGRALYVGVASCPGCATRFATGNASKAERRM